MTNAWQAFCAIVRPRLWLIATTATVAAGATYMATSRGERVFMAAATIHTGLTAGSGTAGATKPDWFTLKTELANMSLILASGSLADRTLARLDAAKLAPRDRVALKRWGPAGLAKAIATSNVGATDMLRVTVKAPTASLSAEVANAHADAFIAYYQELQAQQASSAREFFERQAAAAQRRLATAEGRLKQFKSDERISNIYEETRYFANRLTELKKAVDDAERDERVATDTLRAVEQEAGRRAPTAIGMRKFVSNPGVERARAHLAELQAREAEAALDPTLAADAGLRAQLASRLAAARTDIARATEKVFDSEIEGADPIRERLAERAASALIERQAAQTRRRALEQAIARLDPEAVSYARKEATLTQLKRESSSLEQEFLDLLEKRNRARILEDERRVSSALRVIERAEPPDQPQSAKVGLLTLVAFAIGAAGTTGLLLLLALLDRRPRGDHETRRDLGLATLATIPAAPAEGGSPLSAQLLAHLAGEVAGAPCPLVGPFDRLAGSLLAEQGGRSPRIVLVASHAHGQGKSLVAAHLALSLARKGFAVALVDADLRGGTAAAALCAAPAPGVAEWAAGDVSPEALLQPTFADGLAVVAPGRRFFHSADVLGRSRMADLAAALRERHDFVVIDSLAACDGPDPLLVARHADASLMVVSAEAPITAEDQALRDGLAAAGARPLGAVVNAGLAPVARRPFPAALAPRALAGLMKARSR